MNVRSSSTDFQTFRARGRTWCVHGGHWIRHGEKGAIWFGEDVPRDERFMHMTCVVTRIQMKENGQPLPYHDEPVSPFKKVA